MKKHLYDKIKLFEKLNMNSKLKKAIERAKRGEFPEYWLQLYIKENWKKLGLDSLEGPFEKGCDFKGVYKGKKINIEAERHLKDFVYQRHDPEKIDMLIVLDDMDTEEVLGMKPRDWKKRLPKKIVKVDAEDFVKSTHEARKNYAKMKNKEFENLKSILPFLGIKKSLGTLYDFFAEETEGQEAMRLYGPESEVFDEATAAVAILYINFNNLNLEELRKGAYFTRIEVLVNLLIKSDRDYEDLTDEEKSFLKYWFEILKSEYARRL